MCKSPSFLPSSPSDLEADLEDNQDYDSTVSQSETNLTLIGQGSCLPSNHAKVRMHLPSEAGTARLANPTSSRKEVDFCRPVSYPSRYRDQDFDLERLGSKERGLIRATFAPQKGVESNGEIAGQGSKEKVERPLHGHHHHYHHHHVAADSHLGARNRELERVGGVGILSPAQPGWKSTQLCKVF